MHAHGRVLPAPPTVALDLHLLVSVDRLTGGIITVLIATRMEVPLEFSGTCYPVVAVLALHVPTPSPKGADEELLVCGTGYVLILVLMEYGL